MPLALALLAFCPGTAQGDDGRRDLYGDPLPPGARARLGTVRLRHSELAGLAFSPDGATLASAGGETLRLWDAGSGRPLRRIRNPERYVRDVAFLDGGRLVSSETDSTVRVWDIAGEKELLRLDALSAQIGECVLAHSRDRKRIASVSSHKTVLAWDSASGKEIFRQVHEGERVHAVDFSPDGNFLAWGRNELLIVRDLRSGKEVLKLAADEKFVLAVAFSPDGAILASGGCDGAIRVCDRAAGREIRKLRGHSDYLTGIAFTPDGKALVSVSDDGTLRSWDIDGGRQVLEIREERPIKGLALSPDGRTAAVRCENDHEIRLWDLAAGRRRARQHGHGNLVMSVAVSPDGKAAATGCIDGTARLWEMATGKPLHALAGPVTDAGRRDGRVFAVHFSRDGGTLVSRAGGALHLWDPATGKRRLTIESSKDSGFVASGLSPDAKRLVTRNQDAVIQVWDAESGRKAREWKGPEASQGAVVFTPDGNAAVTEDSRGFVRFWDPETGKVVRELQGDPGGTQDFAISPDGRLLATGHDGGEVRLWDAATGGELLRRAASERKTGAVAFSPDGKLLATGGEDGVIRVWDVHAGEEVLRTPPGMGEVMSIAFGARGETFVAARDNEETLVWSTVVAATGEPEALWADLAGRDARKAYAAVCGLAAAPKMSLPFLSERLRAVPHERITALVRDLDDDDAGTRGRASRDLELLGSEAVPALRAALAGAPPAETRGRMEALVAALQGPFMKSVGGRRKLRVVQALERMGTRGARELLESLGRGPDGAWETRDARQALERLRP